MLKYLLMYDKFLEDELYLDNNGDKCGITCFIIALLVVYLFLLIKLPIVFLFAFIPIAIIAGVLILFKYLEKQKKCKRLKIYLNYLWIQILTQKVLL